VNVQRKGGALIHRQRRICYRYIAGQDLLGDWIVAQFWNSLDQGKGQRRTRVYASVEALELDLTTLIARYLRDGYEPVAPSATSYRAGVDHLATPSSHPP